MRDSAKRGSGEQRQMDSSNSASGKRSGGLGNEDDGSYTVKIQGAGVDAFELMVPRFCLVQDAIMTILNREEVAPRTSLALTLSGANLDPFAELQSVKGFKAGVTLRLIEEPYSPRSAQAHLARVQELLSAPSPQDDLREGRSPSVLNTLTHTADVASTSHSSKGKRANNKSEQLSETPLPPDYILPGATERPPLATVLPTSTYPEVPNCLLDLSLSSWNPPPGSRKLQGDYLYISVQTLEGDHYDITSSPRGFYLNRSTVNVFDPRPASSTPVYHCLTDLLSQLSPQFKHNFSALRHRPTLSTEESMSTPYRTMSWLGGSALYSHKTNHSCRLGLEQGFNSQAPDWNEEMQTARDLPQTTLEERLQREKALLQVNSAFTWAVAQAAEKVIEGFVDPISGSNEAPAFLWGGLFMNIGGPGEDWLGGERGRRAAQRLELQAIQAYSDLEGDLQALHTLPTALTDYRGLRLCAQGLAPGLQAQDQSGVSTGLLYSLSTGPLENPARRKLLQLLAQSAKALGLQRNAVVGPTGYQVALFTSMDAKGQLGADGRYYILDVFRTAPADANFCLAEGEEEAKEGSVPRRFPHGLCRLRPELVKAFVQHKHTEFTKHVREKMEESGGMEDCGKSGDSRGTEAVRAACKDVGSISDIIFEMRFNPNVFSPGVQFPSSESAAVALQERLLREAAAFIVNDQIPAFMDDCLHCNEMPIDGATLRQALHQKGINLRYLGHLISSINQSDHKEQLRHITRLAYGEIVVRCARRIFNGYIQGVELSNLSAAASHFFCCLLVPHFSPASNSEESKKRSRRRGHKGGGSADNTTWSLLSGNELWTHICQDALETYGLKQGLGSNIDQLVEQYGLQKLSLLREICLKTGVQLRLRDYILDNRTKAPITPDDVLNLLPVVKHITMPTTDAMRSFCAAKNSLQKGLLEQAYEQLKEAAYLFGRVCDSLHPEACHCLSLLAKMAYVQGHPAEARSVQMRVVVISERVLGFDHPNTIQQYALLAVYVFAGGETALALRCLYRAKSLMLTVHGEDHPYTAVLDSSLGLMLQGEQSLQYLQSALRLNTSFRGAMDLTTALNHHLLAQRMCVAGDYRGAMAQEKEAHIIFGKQCGDNHPQTKCSSDFLKAVTQQAVRVERSIRQGGAELTDLSTPENLVPSLETILEQLALVNGILKTSYSMRIMEFKEKLKERRACEDSEKAEANSSNEVKVVEEAASSEKQSEEVIDGNAKNQPEKTDALEDRPDHTQMNGEFESHIQNGDCATSAPEEDGKSSILSIKSQSESKEIITATNTEPALVNGECKVVDEVMLVEKETPKN
ncbi:clustered mitochondria protein homolog [Pangasianodon hypophthalmus]|uniref:clustered mitochondria protein homolog n=1 Tax=Pangasianodon hypophthalmus TaxID=310915 RepID=UPI0023073368|nr:clustered mitochondria protein homolog [Pangasianodon hypophthalmus]